MVSKSNGRVKNLKDEQNKYLFRWLCDAKNAQNTEIKGLDLSENDALNKAVSDYGRSYQLDSSQIHMFHR